MAVLYRAESDRGVVPWWVAVVVLLLVLCSACNSGPAGYVDFSDDDDASGDDDDTSSPPPADVDEDGYGDDVDCDDLDPSLHPGDLDGDGVSPCDGDCDDDPLSGAQNFPGNAELCDGQDNDCDSSVDEGLAQQSWYRDVDGDGFGDASAVAVLDCLAPPDSVNNNTDCDDTLPGGASIFPGQAEACDGIDNNCVDGVDEGFDQDGDGVTTCGADGDPVSLSDNDCDESVATGADNFPGNTEICDGQDNDCDGLLDVNAGCSCVVENTGGRAYRFCEVVATWFQARDGCRAEPNYELVTIDDAVEQAWVLSRANSLSGSHWWWIGYNDLGASSAEEPGSAWEWVDGSTSTYTNWAGGQPDNWFEEDCAHLYADGTWNDLDCAVNNWANSYFAHYICEASID